MAAWMVPAAMMALSVLKSATDKQNAKDQMKFEADLAPWSPWSRRPIQMPEQPNAFNTLLQGAAAGADYYTDNQRIAAMQSGQPQMAPMQQQAMMQSGQAGFYNPYNDAEYWFGRKV